MAFILDDETFIAGLDYNTLRNNYQNKAKADLDGAAPYRIWTWAGYKDTPTRRNQIQALAWLLKHFEDDLSFKLPEEYVDYSEKEQVLEVQNRRIHALRVIAGVCLYIIETNGSGVLTEELTNLLGINTINQFDTGTRNYCLKAIQNEFSRNPDFHELGTYGLDNFDTFDFRFFDNLSTYVGDALSQIDERELDYELALMSTLPDNNPDSALLGKIYVSEKGFYVVRAVNEAVHQGKLDTKINLKDLEHRLNDLKLKNSILACTSKKGHTQGDSEESKALFPCMRMASVTLAWPASTLGYSIGAIAGQALSHSTTLQNTQWAATAAIGSFIYMVMGPTAGITLLAPTIASQTISNACGISMAVIGGKAFGYAGTVMGALIGIPFDVLWLIGATTTSYVFDSIWAHSEDKKPEKGVSLIEGTCYIKGQTFELAELPEGINFNKIKFNDSDNPLTEDEQINQFKETISPELFERVTNLDNSILLKGVRKMVENNHISAQKADITSTDDPASVEAEKALTIS